MNEFYVAYCGGVYGSSGVDGWLEGPYDTLEEADEVVQTVQAAMAYVADARGNPHPDLDAQVRQELLQELYPHPPERWKRVPAQS